LLDGPEISGLKFFVMEGYSELITGMICANIAKVFPEDEPI